MEESEQYYYTSQSSRTEINPKTDLRVSSLNSNE